MVQGHRLAITLPAMTLPDTYNDLSPAPMSRFAHQRAGLHTPPFLEWQAIASKRVCTPSEVWQVLE
jgi:hypothetical protein